MVIELRHSEMGQGCLTWCLGQVHTLEPLSYSILFPFLNNRVKVCLGLVTFLHLVFLDLVVLGGGEVHQ